MNKQQRYSIYGCLMLCSYLAAAARDPFQPLDIEHCYPTNPLLLQWTLYGTLQSAYRTSAMFGAPEVKAIDMALGESIPGLPWRLTTLTAEFVEFTTLSPCPLTTLRISLAGLG